MPINLYSPIVVCSSSFDCSFVTSLKHILWQHYDQNTSRESKHGCVYIPTIVKFVIMLVQQLILHLYGVMQVIFPTT